MLHNSYVTGRMRSGIKTFQISRGVHGEGGGGDKVHKKIRIADIKWNFWRVNSIEGLLPCTCIRSLEKVSFII